MKNLAISLIVLSVVLIGGAYLYADSEEIVYEGYVNHVHYGEITGYTFTITQGASPDSEVVGSVYQLYPQTEADAINTLLSALGQGRVRIYGTKFVDPGGVSHLVAPSNISIDAYRPQPLVVRPIRKK